MNKYITPICDIQSGKIWNQVILARTVSACQDKLMEILMDQYDLGECLTYREFVEQADDNDILIGEIRDVEVL